MLLSHPVSSDGSSLMPCAEQKMKQHVSHHIQLLKPTSVPNVRFLIHLDEFKAKNCNQGTAKAPVSGRHSPLQYAAALSGKNSSYNLAIAEALLEQLQ